MHHGNRVYRFPCQRWVTAPQLLHGDVPTGRDHRAPGGHPGPVHQHRLRCRPRPHALPRLLRQGVRRVGAGGVDVGQRRGEGLADQQPEPTRLRGHRRRQGSPGGRLPRRRLLRRRPRLRRQGQRRAHRGSPVRRAGRPEGRHGVARVGGGGQHPGADVHAGPAHPELCRQGPHTGGDGHAIRRAHHRTGALHVVQRPPLQLQRDGRRGPQRRPGVPVAAPPRVPRGTRRRRGRRPRRAHGAPHAQRLRRALLLGRAPQPRPLHLRPGAAVQPAHRRAGQAERVRRIPVEAQVRPRHGEDGADRGAHRRQRRDQDQVQRCQLNDPSSAHLSLLHCLCGNNLLRMS